VAVAAARTRGAVVTTNFDPFLERALADLGMSSSLAQRLA
jgi:hypothetical protein